MNKKRFLTLLSAATIAFTSAFYGKLETQIEATEAASPLTNPELFARELYVMSMIKY